METIPASEYANWPLDRLSNYIEQTFHNYIRETVPSIREQLHALNQDSRTASPATIELEHLFIVATNELERHLCREENDLFPIIQIITTGKGTVDMGRLREVNAILLREHEAERNFFKRIALLATQYKAPSTTEAALVKVYKQLQEFDSKLRRHIELENEALFPTALEMAEQVAQH